MSTIRTRFAPSPTGSVHVGNIRAAIFNWLYARHTGGKFLLRVEDTDRARSTPEAIQNLLEAMNWLGLQADEEPLYQSSRTDAHLAAAEDLLKRGLAYREDKGGTGQGEAVVFRMPGEDMSFEDQIKGPLSKKAENLQDFVIVRSNGTPVFHLANVLDDLEMGVTHVIRGDDHVENTFRHMALFRALGAEPPVFAHLPMIVNAQGKPYSKRDGDAFVGDFRDQGILPEALFNYLVLLGWSPGDDREVLSREEMIAAFDLSGVQSSAAQMDLKKLDWMNGAYILQMSDEHYCEAALQALTDGGVELNGMEPERIHGALELLKTRIRRFPDLVSMGCYFFTEDFPFDAKAVRKRLQKPEALDHLRAVLETLSALSAFGEADLEAALAELASERGCDVFAFFPPLRIAVSGQAGGPDLLPLLSLLGQSVVCQRIERALALYGELSS